MPLWEIISRLQQCLTQTPNSDLALSIRDLTEELEREMVRQDQEMSAREHARAQGLYLQDWEPCDIPW